MEAYGPATQRIGSRELVHLIPCGINEATLCFLSPLLVLISIHHESPTHALSLPMSLYHYAWDVLFLEGKSTLTSPWDIFVIMESYTSCISIMAYTLLPSSTSPIPIVVDDGAHIGHSLSLFAPIDFKSSLAL